MDLKIPLYIILNVPIKLYFIEFVIWILQLSNCFFFSEYFISLLHWSAMSAEDTESTLFSVTLALSTEHFDTSL